MNKKSILTKLHIFGKNVKKCFRNQKFTEDLSNMQELILHFIIMCKKENLFQKDIEKEFHLKKSNASEILQSLENLNYLERKISKEDARCKKIILTEKSIILRDKLKKNFKKIEKQVIKDLSEDELEFLSKIIDKMITNTIKEEK